MVNPLLHIKAGIKYLFSFRKNEWSLSDYPIRYRHFEASPDDAGQDRLQLIPCSAQVINWWQMDGGGNSKAEAYSDLQAKVSKLKEEGKSLPRPVTGLPIEFASTLRVRLYDDTAVTEIHFRRQHPTSDWSGLAGERPLFVVAWASRSSAALGLTL